MVDRAKKITELTAVTSITNNDVFIVVTNTAGTAATKKITINNFRAGLPPVVVGIANTSCTGLVIVSNNLTINASGYLSLSSNINVSNVVTDDLTATGNVYLGVADSNTAQLVHIHGTIHSNVVPHTSFNYTLGSPSGYWLSGYIGGITIANNRIIFADNTSISTASRGSPPATASSNGTPGAISFDSDYLYVCVANNTWKRAALSTWS